MYKATRTYLDLNPTVWNSLPANVGAHATLSGYIDQIDAKVTAQEAELSGHTQHKAQRRAALHTNILRVAGAAEAYARVNNLPLLLADVELEERDLVRASGQTVDDIAQRVRDAANGVLASLADYGITAPDITDLETAMTDFNAAKSMPDAVRAIRTGHTATLEPQFRTTSQFLDGQLDVLMRRYKTEDPNFHAGYEAARVIIDLHGPGEEDDDPPPPPPVP